MFLSGQNGDTEGNGNILSHTLTAEPSLQGGEEKPGSWKVKAKSNVLDGDTELFSPLLTGGHQLCPEFCEGDNSLNRL